MSEMIDLEHTNPHNGEKTAISMKHATHIVWSRGTSFVTIYVVGGSEGIRLDWDSPEEALKAYNVFKQYLK